MTKDEIIRSDTRIGSMSAEADDDFLFECFVDHPAKTQVSDVSSPKMFLIGGTGSGKTAIMRMIEKESENCTPFNIQEMALNYINNSDSVKFLDAIDVKLDQLFQALWKHVLCMEYIKLSRHIENEEKSRNIFAQFVNAFRSDRKREIGIKYLEKWKDKFWITMDETVREVTNSIDSEVKAELGAEISKFKANAGYRQHLSDLRKSQFQQRARKFASGTMLSELAHVQAILSELTTHSDPPCYILIDQLDEDWADHSIKYRLIRALIEAVKSMRKIHNLKVIISLRHDLLDKTIEKTKDDGFQSEKYEDYFVRLKWSKKDLKKVVDKRINKLYRRAYTKDNVHFEDIFTGKVFKKEPFDYICDRTNMRPRDVISFVNLAFESAEGNVSINQSRISQAERIYSERRLEAMAEEWSLVYPGAWATIECLRGLNEPINAKQLYNDSFLMKFIEKFSEDEAYQTDSIYTASTDSLDLNSIIPMILSRLHTMGAVAIKTDNSHSYNWYHETHTRVTERKITPDAKFRISPMLHSALGIRTKN